MITILQIVITLLILALIAVSHWLLQRQINDFNQSATKSTSSCHHHNTSATSQSKNPTWIQVDKMMEKVESLQFKVDRLESEIEKFKTNFMEHAGRPIGTTDEDKARNGNMNDGRIWVQKSGEGMLLLTESKDRQGIYLTKSGNNYLLHIIDIYVDKHMNLTSLYKDVVSFPPEVSKTDELVMSKNPVYTKFNSDFRFKEKGEITIRR